MTYGSPYPLIIFMVSKYEIDYNSNSRGKEVQKVTIMKSKLVEFFNKHDFFEVEDSENCGLLTS